MTGEWGNTKITGRMRKKKEGLGWGIRYSDSPLEVFYVIVFISTVKLL